MEFFYNPETLYELFSDNKGSCFNENRKAEIYTSTLSGKCSVS